MKLVYQMFTSDFIKEFNVNQIRDYTFKLQISYTAKKISSFKQK